MLLHASFSNSLSESAFLNGKCHICDDKRRCQNITECYSFLPEFPLVCPQSAPLPPLYSWSVLGRAPGWSPLHPPYSQPQKGLKYSIHKCTTTSHISQHSTVICWTSLQVNQTKISFKIFPEGKIYQTVLSHRFSATRTCDFSMKTVLLLVGRLIVIVYQKTNCLVSATSDTVQNVKLMCDQTVFKFCFVQ